MSFSIQFDNQFSGKADKVGNVRPDWCLSAKMQSVRCLQLFQVRPQLSLERSLFTTKTLCCLPGFSASPLPLVGRGRGWGSATSSLQFPTCQAITGCRVF